MADLYYAPLAEMARIRRLDAPSDRRAAAYAAAARINALYMIARAGSGHIGTTFSCIDIVSWLFVHEMRLPDVPDAPRDIYFSSKGHDAPALYAVLTGLGLLDFDLIHKLRRLGGLPGHPDVSTPFSETNTGSLGMGISKAKGIALANRLQGRAVDIYVITGDGELQEGQLWESLPSAVTHGLGELTVVVDHNKIQSDTWVKDVSDLGDVEAKFTAFGWHVDRCNGHDLRAVAAAFGRLRHIRERPKVLIADTLKGKGVSFMEPAAMDSTERLYRFHSGAPSDDVYAKAVAELIDTANAQLWQLGAPALALETVERPVPAAPGRVHRLVNAYSRALVRAAERRPDLVVLDADLILDCGLIPFRQKFPDRFFECGIAEQDMVSQAGGMALRGLLPVVHSFACFLSARPNEQIHNNATERTKVVYVGSLAGLLPAGPGHTHQSVRDISAVGAVPDLILVEPAAESAVEQVVEFCVDRATSSCYIRLVSIPAELPFEWPEGRRLEPGRGVTLREGRDGVIVGYGPVMLAQAYRAAMLLAERGGPDLAVVDLPWLNRVDRTWLAELAGRYPWLLALDNHYVHGGQGEMLLSALAELQQRPLPRARRLGITRIPLGGGNTEVLRAHRLDAESLAEDIPAILDGRQ
ncbi:MAG: transketolase C-terminal domain-containing protein [Candidatus Rokuibacteriota bacterium]